VKGEPGAAGETPTDADPELRADELGYADAVAELETILEELEGEAVDVDVLANRVRRAAILVRVCRERIAGAKLEIEHIVAELDEQPPASEAGEGSG
jgi:exodeoxyribonuclease VII small subunit